MLRLRRGIGACGKLAAPARLRSALHAEAGKGAPPARGLGKYSYPSTFPARPRCFGFAGGWAPAVSWRCPPGYAQHDTLLPCKERAREAWECAACKKPPLRWRSGFLVWAMTLGLCGDRILSWLCVVTRVCSHHNGWLSPTSQILCQQNRHVVLHKQQRIASKVGYDG